MEVVTESQKYYAKLGNTEKTAPGQPDVELALHTLSVVASHINTHGCFQLQYNTPLIFAQLFGNRNTSHKSCYSRRCQLTIPQMYACSPNLRKYFVQPLKELQTLLIFMICSPVLQGGLCFNPSHLASSLSQKSSRTLL